MKKIVLALAALLFMTAELTGQDQGELIVPFSNPSQKGKIRIDIRKGSIFVKGTNRKDVLISYRGSEIEVDNEEEEHEGLKRITNNLMDLEVSEKNNYIEIESGTWGSDLELNIEVPENVDIHVETYNAEELKISNVSGEIVANNYNGEIIAENISGSMVADTYNGDITVAFNKVAPDTPMAFTTYNGDVDISLPENYKGSLKMKTMRGDIFSGFDLKLTENEPVSRSDNHPGAYQVHIESWVKGDVNGGGAALMIQNYNGDIYLRKK